MNKIPARGEIWIVDLDPTLGHEQAKKRPCLVVSANTYNQGSMGLVVVVPITSKYKPLSWLVTVVPPEGGLSKHSYILCNQIRTISVKRLLDGPLGLIGDKTLKQVEFRLQILLNL